MYVTVRDRPAAAPSRTKAAVGPTVIGLGMVSLLTDISSESVAAILPLYLTGVLGLSTISYGLIDGLYQGASSLVRIAAGWASDRGGHPKWVAVAGYGLSCVARVGFLVATGFAAITAVVTIDRIGKGIRTAPRDAMIAASSDPAHWGHAFGVHRTLDTIGAAIGPVIAFLILWWIPDGYHTVMVVSLVFAVLGLAVLGLFVSEPSGRTEDTEDIEDTEDAADAGRHPGSPTTFRWRDLTNRRLTRVLVVAAGLGLLTVGDGFIYLALLDHGGFAAHWFPLLYVGTNIAYLAFAVPLGRLADRTGRAKVMVTGHLALVGAYLCAVLPLAAAPATLLALALLGTFYAATDGVISALAGSQVSDHVRASGIAAAQTTVALARLGSSTAFGLLWFVVGPATALIVVGSLLVLALPVALLVLAPLDRRTVRA